MIVEVRALRKVYGGKSGVTAVDGIDLNVEAGTIYGLLGPNGAGKTTTISICTTRAIPTAGQVTIAGIDVVAQRGRERVGQQCRALVDGVAAEELVDAGPLGAFGRERPGLGVAGEEGGFGLLGQDQAAQAPARIAQGGVDGVDAVEPDGAARGLRNGDAGAAWRGPRGGVRPVGGCEG